MAPRAATNPAPKSQKGAGKTKTKQDGQMVQTSTVEFGLPTSTATALQSISTRATQDLWTTSTFTAENLTADQLAQRRTNATAKLAKRISGDMRAKNELSMSLGAWFAQLSQHLMGLVGRVRAISTKLDEDLNVAVQDMQSYLIDQPSVATSEQVAQAMQQMGPIWTPPQEQEVVRMAALLRAFGSVVSVPTSAAPSSSSSPPGAGQFSFSGDFVETHGHNLHRPFREQPPRMTMPVDQTSELSFSGGAEPTIPAPTTAIQGPRWKRRTTTPGHRPSKSPRREFTAATGPWNMTATGLTPEGIRREPSTILAEDEPELVPDSQGHIHRGAMVMTWASSWRQLASFSVEHGADLIGGLGVDEAQHAVMPLPNDANTSDVVMQQAEHVWQALKDSVGKRDDSDLLPVCQALHQFLQLIHQNPSVLPQVREGLMLAAHITVGGLLDPYSYAPVTAQEWLYPAMLLEQGGPIRGFLSAEVSSAPEVQGILRQPCPFAASLSGEQPISEASFPEADGSSPAP